MKIVLLDGSTLGDDIDLKDLGEITYYATTSKEQTLERVKNADIVITNKVVIDKEIMESSTIKLICVAATGMNNIDLDHAFKMGIEVKNVAGYSTASVVQTTFSMALYLIEKMRYYDDFTKGNGWIESEIFTNLQQPYFDISGKTWGIIGLGTIGKEVAKIAQAFGANVLYYSTSGVNRDSNFQRSALENLLQNSDIISVHAPLNEATKDLLNRDNLNLLKPQAVVLNLGRGGIINENALAAYIDESQISVGLDVLEKEPMIDTSPFREVKGEDRLLITPHIAWASYESRVKLVDGICKNIKIFLGV